MLEIVWFKRDLRVHDHAPLVQAMQFEAAAGLLVIEPQWLNSPECDAQHVAFYLACAQDLQRELAALGLPLLVRTGSMPQVLEDLRRHWEPDWIRELEDHDGVMINDLPPAPDFAAARIVPHLDPVQRTLWTEWSKAAGWNAVPRGGIDWSELNALQQHPQKIDPWWRP